MASWLARCHDVLFAGPARLQSGRAEVVFSTLESGELHALFSASTRIFTVTPDPHALFA
jgi:hypothetical protein